MSRCEHCNADLSEEMAAIDHYSRPHTVDRCREYLKAALKNVALDAGMMAESNTKLRGRIREMESLLGDVLEGQDILTDKKWLRRCKVAIGDYGP